MKKLSMILVMLLWCNYSYADKITTLSRCYYFKVTKWPSLEVTSFDEMKNIGTTETKIKVVKRYDYILNLTQGVGRSETVQIMGDGTLSVYSNDYVINFYDNKYIKMNKVVSASSIWKLEEIVTIDIEKKEVHMVNWMSTETGIAGGSSSTKKSKNIIKCEKKEGATGSGSGTTVANSGSGFFIDNKGHFVTNYHVIEGCDDKSKITYRKKEYSAELVASDKKADLAVLKAKVKNKGYLNFSYKPKKLLKVYVAGYPFGKMLSDDLNFHDGIISSLKGFEDNTNQITITAALNPGNSGGPVVNESGEVVGVAVSGLSKDVTEGINFAIKSETVKTFLKSNKIKPSSSFYSKKLDSDDLLELLEEGTVYTFCN